MPNPQKSKGNRLENEVSDWLTYWATGLSSGSAGYSKWFSRGSDSGGLATKHMKKIAYMGFSTTDPLEQQRLISDLRNRDDICVGDIYPTNLDSKAFLEIFSIECKNYENIEWHKIIQKPGTGGSNTSFFKFWEKHVNQCNIYGKIPILVYRETRARTMFPTAFVPHDLIKHMPNREETEAFRLGTLDIYGMEIYRLNDLFRFHTFEEIVEAQSLRKYAAKANFKSKVNPAKKLESLQEQKGA